LKSAPVSRVALRRAIDVALPHDADLDAFVQSFAEDLRYARVRREWGDNMQRQRKLSLLLDYGPPADKMADDLMAFVK
jgi:hypothetical protein